ncbi:MAG: hypothetical protein M3008_08655 [Chloroflexota bacterium]|nr:hypothetical protein [Chloroflexota bacterium]
MVTAQFTAPRTIVTKSSDILPATIDQQTDFTFITTAMAVYYKQSGCLGSFDTAILVADAMRDSSAVVTMYTDGKGEQAARVLWPSSITLSGDNNITARCYCTLRRRTKRFRLDRMLTCHALTTPDDIAAA